MIKMGRSNPHQISQVHVADGFCDDCDELISRCTQLSTVDFQSFCCIWKEMNLGYMYHHGRLTGAEIAELSEEVVLIAKHYMVKSTSNFEESVAGLFLVYALLTLQPYSDFAWLRIVPDDVPALRRIETVARKEKRLDVLYVLGDVLVRRTQYHAVERERGMEKSYRKYLEGYTSIDRLGVRPKGVFYRQNEELDIIRELGSVTRQYVRAKTNIGAGEEAASSSLSYIDNNLADDLNSSLKKIISGFLDPDDKNDDDDDSEPDHYTSVQAIKNKAMMNTVNPMKHLTAVNERKPEKTNIQENDLKAASGKIKTGSPTKPIAGSPSKRSPTKKSSPKKRKKGKYLATFDYPCVDLNLDEFNQEPETIVPDIENDSDNDEQRIITVQTDGNTDIELESLPVIIKTGDYPESFEIEIFDAYDKDTTDSSPSTSKDTLNKTTVDENKVKTKGINLKRNVRLKKDLKRSNLKTKFKKMGMLSVANFTEEKK